MSVWVKLRGERLEALSSLSFDQIVDHLHRELMIPVSFIDDDRVVYATPWAVVYFHEAIDE